MSIAVQAVFRARQAPPLALLAQPEPGGAPGHAARPAAQEGAAPAAQAVALEGAVAGEAGAVALHAGPLHRGIGAPAAHGGFEQNFIRWETFLNFPHELYRVVSLLEAKVLLIFKCLGSYSYRTRL